LRATWLLGRRVLGREREDEGRRGSKGCGRSRSEVWASCRACAAASHRWMTAMLCRQEAHNRTRHASVAAQICSCTSLQGTICSASCPGPVMHSWRVITPRRYAEWESRPQPAGAGSWAAEGTGKRSATKASKQPRRGELAERAGQECGAVKRGWTPKAGLAHARTSLQNAGNRACNFRPAWQDITPTACWR